MNFSNIRSYSLSKFLGILSLVSVLVAVVTGGIILLLDLFEIDPILPLPLIVLCPGCVVGWAVDISITEIVFNIGFVLVLNIFYFALFGVPIWFGLRESKLIIYLVFTVFFSWWGYYFITLFF